FKPCPVCSPARASFWTGALPSVHGIHDYIQERSVHGEAHPGLAGQTNLAMRLRQAGYRTGLVGKWHCGHSDRVHAGFDFWFSISRGTDARFGEQRFCDNGESVTDHGHQAPVLTEAALRFLRGAARDEARPWFLFVGYTDTHGPFQGEPARLVEHYRRCDFDDLGGESAAPCHGSIKPVQPERADEVHESNAQYYAAVNLIDEKMGRVLDELDNRGELENTLIVYTSDHGHMNGHHGLWGKGNRTIPQNFLEEAIRVPCLLSWPGGFEGGQVRREPVDHCDLHATLLDVAGVSGNDAELAQSAGRSCLPLLCGERLAEPWRDAQCCEYGNARMIRTEEAKLIRRYPGPNGHFRDELYDLAADPRETRNAIDEPQRAEQVRRLSDQLDAYFARWKTSSRSGVRIADQPRPNGSEPWSHMPRDAARALLREAPRQP
ncbi:MAG: sulfatase, partial [Phycisphaeraceae bacterium]